MTKSSDWIAVENKYYAQTVRRQPVVLVRGEGTRVWDADGKEYLDFVAGWAVNNLGHSHPAITQAIVEQAGTLIQTSNQFYTVPQLMLAELLVENSCIDRVFFCCLTQDIQDYYSRVCSASSVQSSSVAPADRRIQIRKS